MIHPTGDKMIENVVAVLSGSVSHGELCSLILEQYLGTDQNYIRRTIVRNIINHPSRLFNGQSQFSLVRTAEGRVERYDEKKHGIWNVEKDSFGHPYLTRNGIRAETSKLQDKREAVLSSLTAEALFSISLSRAIDEVRSKVREGTEIADQRILSEETVSIYKKAFKELKSIIYGAAEILESNHLPQIEVAMARWNILGCVFDTISGSFFHTDATSAGDKIAELFISRNHNTLEWGIRLNDKAEKSEISLSKVAESLLPHISNVEKFLQNGYSIEVSKGDAKELNYSLTRKVEIKEDEALTMTAQELASELVVLFPLYQKIFQDLKLERLVEKGVKP